MNTVELIKIVIWPVIVLIVIIYFINKFKREIGEQIKKIETLYLGKNRIELTKANSKDLKEKQRKTKKSEIEKFKEKNNKLKNEKESTLKDQNLLSLFYHFEKTYRLIFGSQIIIVAFANLQTKISEASARGIYSNTTWINTYPYEQYMGFLINSGLISSLNPTDQSYYIQPLGQEFIRYLTNNNIALTKLPY